MRPLTASSRLITTASTAAGGASVLVLLAYAFAGAPSSVAVVRADDRWALAGSGMVLAALGWWAAWLGPIANAIYRGTMAMLAGAGASLWLLRWGSSDAAPHVPVLATLGGVGLAFSWIPAGVIKRFPPSKPQGGRGASR